MVLQDYQSQLLKSDLITPDVSHHLFLNLNNLVDFQRRFLIGVEANASQAPDQQHFGLLFQEMVLSALLHLSAVVFEKITHTRVPGQ
jgi:cell division control protein 24